MNHPWLQIQEHRPGDVVLIISLCRAAPQVLPYTAQLRHLVATHVVAHKARGGGTKECKDRNAWFVPPWGGGNDTEADRVSMGHLVEEHILSVGPFSGELLNDPLRTDAVLSTQLLPKLKTNCKHRHQNEGNKINKFMLLTATAIQDALRIAVTNLLQHYLW